MRIFLKGKHFLLGKQKDPAIERHQKKHSLTAVFYIGLFAALIYLLINCESKGKEAAEAILKRIESNAVQQSEIITVKIDDKAKQLLSLACGERNCAGIELSTKTVYYFPQNGHSFQLIDSNPIQSPPSATKKP